MNRKQGVSDQRTTSTRDPELDRERQQYLEATFDVYPSASSEKSYPHNLTGYDPMTVDYQRPEPKYYSRIPNLVDEMGLTSHAVRLYLHYKHAAGDSQRRPITEGADRLSRLLKMGNRSVLAARRELEARGLIRVSKAKFNGTWGVSVTVLDIWEENIAAYAEHAESMRRH